MQLSQVQVCCICYAFLFLLTSYSSGKHPKMLTSEVTTLRRHLQACHEVCLAMHSIIDALLIGINYREHILHGVRRMSSSQCFRRTQKHARRGQPMRDHRAGSTVIYETSPRSTQGSSHTVMSSSTRQHKTGSLRQIRYTSLFALYLVELDSYVSGQPLQALQHPAFREMIDIAARATNGVKIYNMRNTRQAIIETFKQNLTRLGERLNVSVSTLLMVHGS